LLGDGPGQVDGEADLLQVAAVGGLGAVGDQERTGEAAVGQPEDNAMVQQAAVGDGDEAGVGLARVELAPAYAVGHDLAHDARVVAGCFAARDRRQCDDQGGDGVNDAHSSLSER
jgi:hypothetical protein